VNIKHVKPQQEGESGRIVTMEAPIHSSNVMLYSTKQTLSVAFATPLTMKGRKVRMLKKTGEIIDNRAAYS